MSERWIAEFWSYPQSRISPPPDRLRGGPDVRAVIVGMLRDDG
jgi:hypothetical protein